METKYTIDHSYFLEDAQPECPFCEVPGQGPPVLAATGGERCEMTTTHSDFHRAVMAIGHAALATKDAYTQAHPEDLEGIAAMEEVCRLALMPAHRLATKRLDADIDAALTRLERRDYRGDLV